ncbi:MAG: type II secretion system F family protein [Leifsonia sp.]
MVPVSASLAWSLVLGCTLGLGLWSLAATIPRLSRPRLIDRVAPYVVDVSASARDHVDRRSTDPLPVLGVLAAPVLSAGRSLLSRLFGGSDTAALRLRQAGSAESVERLRSEQVVWALVGGSAGLVIVLVVSTTRDVPPAVQVLVPLAGAFSGAAMRDAVLRRSARRRMARMEAELPTVLEFLTLSLSAGEGIHDAVRRVARTGSGELAGELSALIARVNSGVSFTRAMNEFAEGLRLPALSRAVDHLVTAIDRGTPLAGVLRAQAHDARAEARNRLMETAGRKEVAMLIPLVFLILPLTVVIAILPGLFVLQTGF